MRRNKRDYTYRSMRDEREYGPYWYSGLWRVLRPVLVGLTTLLVMAGLLTSGWNAVYNRFLAPTDLQDETAVPFTVESGQSLTRVSANLEEAGLIRSKTVFKYYCDFAGMGQKIQAGSYQLNRAMTMQQIADAIADRVAMQRLADGEEVQA